MNRLTRAAERVDARNGRAIDRAFARAVRNALIAHKRDGDPIATMRDGEVIWVPADEIDIPDDPEARTEDDGR